MAKIKEPARQLSVLYWFFHENCQLFKTLAKNKNLALASSLFLSYFFLFFIDLKGY
jgi:hypothetical protein